MAPANPERSEGEIEFFRRRATWSVESEGILDRAGVPATEFIGNIGRLVAETYRRPASRVELGADQLARWHGFIFRRTRMPIVGRFRTEDDPPVGFAVPTYDDGTERPVELPVKVAAPTDIRPRLDACFERFNTDAAKTSSAEEKARTVAELWSEVLLIHPFNDGNTRTTMTLLQASLRKLELPRFLTAPHDWELALARSYVLRPDERRTTEVLADLIGKRTGVA